MRNTILLILLVLSFNACKNDKQSKEDKKEMAYTSIGKEIIADDALEASSMSEHFNSMKAGDTIDSKMSGKIVEVSHEEVQEVAAKTEPKMTFLMKELIRSLD